MTNADIEGFLLRLRPTQYPFTVIQTGKRSKKVNGLYKPETREILIHNRNFTETSDLLRTAIHEYAHHLHYTSERPPKPGRPHDTRFWSLFHDLLTEAERRDLYVDVFRRDPEFIALTSSIKNELLQPNARLFQELGARLVRAEALCRARSLNFRDYLERELGLRMPTARLAMAFVNEELPPELTPDQVRTVLKLPKVERAEAVASLLRGQTEAQVLARTASTPDPRAQEDPVEALRRRKRRVEALIQKYRNELQELEEHIRRAERREA